MQPWFMILRRTKFFHPLFIFLQIFFADRLVTFLHSFQEILQRSMMSLGSILHITFYFLRFLHYNQHQVKQVLKTWLKQMAVTSPKECNRIIKKWIIELKPFSLKSKYWSVYSYEYDFLNAQAQFRSLDNNNKILM